MLECFCCIIFDLSLPVIKIRTENGNYSVWKITAVWLKCSKSNYNPNLCDKISLNIIERIFKQKKFEINPFHFALLIQVKREKSNLHSRAPENENTSLFFAS